MFAVRIHGRGGQGAVTAAEVLSVAAFTEGRHAQAFPTFGSERTGAPGSVTTGTSANGATTRISVPSAVSMRSRWSGIRSSGRRKRPATVWACAPGSHQAARNGSGSKGKLCSIRR